MSAEMLFLSAEGKNQKTIERQENYKQLKNKYLET
jgi:hypothetical protein